jgi:hypothetical protein
MEIIRKGSDVLAVDAPRACCFPAGSLGFRVP